MVVVRKKMVTHTETFKLKMYFVFLLFVEKDQKQLHTLETKFIDIKVFYLSEIAVIP